MTKDTIPAPPVESVNPVAELRRQVDEGAVALRRVTTLGGWSYVGMQSIGVYFTDVTPHMEPEDAFKWLSGAKYSITSGGAFPSFCINGHLKTTPGVCGHCLGGKK